MELASQDVFVGDLIASGIPIGGMAFTGRAMRPPFEDVPQAVAGALNRMAERGGKRFYMGHGGPLEASEVSRHVRTLSQLPRKCCDDGHHEDLTHLLG